MFKLLQQINSRPAPFEFYTANALWADDHISAQMLSYHLDGTVDISSRKTEFIDRSANWIASRFKLSQGKAVADFGCGPGLYTTRLASLGGKVTGIDFSARSIDYARKTANEKSLDIDYHHKNYLEFETDNKFDLITMIMCDFCALSPKQRKKMLEKFFSLLNPGGSVLLDCYSLKAFDAREEGASYAPNLMDGFWSPGDYFGFVNTFKYDDEKVMLDKYTIIEARQTRVIYNWLQYFDTQTIEKDFENFGFAAIELIGNVAGDKFDKESHEFAVIAQKP